MPAPAPLNPLADLGVSLRESVPSDSEFVYLVKVAAFREYVERVWEWDEQEQRQRHDRRCASQDVRIVQVGDQDVGFLSTERTPGHLAVRQLFIHPSHQRRGVGTACMGRLISEADRVGLVIALQVLKVNRGARRFYERLGFRSAGETHTHIQMQRGPKRGDHSWVRTEK